MQCTVPVARSGNSILSEILQFKQDILDTTAIICVKHQYGLLKYYPKYCSIHLLKNIIVICDIVVIFISETVSAKKKKKNTHNKVSQFGEKFHTPYFYAYDFQNLVTIDAANNSSLMCRECTYVLRFV